ncbi:unnamed protein product [Polarella glacialis]|uniref:U-box domain-containing protein n=1 Tax=Polarella glacialis TaxID=89957 RepID=A0A813ING8_POLGL|nr:unnamed protein product [Polarella glacialis]
MTTAVEPSQYAVFGQHWGEAAARCFSFEGDFMNDESNVRLMPVPDSFLCPITGEIMQDPVATVDGQVYDRLQIQKWIQFRRQRQLEITSPSTNMPLPSPTLVPVIALQKAIETYLLHRPEVRNMHVASRSVEEAAELLQNELLEKQAVHQSVQEELNRLRATVNHLEACEAENQVLRHLVEEQKLQLEDMAARFEAMEGRSASSREDGVVQAQTLPNQEQVSTDHGRQVEIEEAILPLEEADRRNSDADNNNGKGSSGILASTESSVSRGSTGSAGSQQQRQQWTSTQLLTPPVATHSTQADHQVTPGPSQPDQPSESVLQEQDEFRQGQRVQIVDRECKWNGQVGSLVKYIPYEARWQVELTWQGGKRQALMRPERLCAVSSCLQTETAEPLSSRDPDRAQIAGSNPIHTLSLHSPM